MEITYWNLLNPLIQADMKELKHEAWSPGGDLFFYRACCFRNKCLMQINSLIWKLRIQVWCILHSIDAETCTHTDTKTNMNYSWCSDAVSLSSGMAPNECPHSACTPTSGLPRGLYACCLTRGNDRVWCFQKANLIGLSEPVCYSTKEYQCLSVKRNIHIFP